MIFTNLFPDLTVSTIHSTLKLTIANVNLLYNDQYVVTLFEK